MPAEPTFVTLTDVSVQAAVYKQAQDRAINTMGTLTDLIGGAYFAGESIEDIAAAAGFGESMVVGWLHERGLALDIEIEEDCHE